jgi:thiamine biosynthesis lipoprotein
MELRKFDFTSPHMGTLFRISLYTTNEAWAEFSAQAAFQRVEELDEKMSDYRADSELMRLCDQPNGKAVPVSDDMFSVIKQSLRLSEASRGAFDITVGPFVRLWRFSRKRHTLPEPAQIEEARAAVGWKNVKLDSATRTVTLTVPDMRLDLGGIAKGYAADAALAVLREKGVTRAFVAASGDIAIGDPPPDAAGWKIGINELGGSSNSLSQTLVLKHAGISTSGSKEQFVEIGGVKYSHIVNPVTGLGLTNNIQATIIAPDATTSDGLATAVTVLGVEQGKKLAGSFPGSRVIFQQNSGN